MPRQVAPQDVQKRRVIYVSDVEWKALKKLATTRKVTISEMIRDAVTREN